MIFEIFLFNLFEVSLQGHEKKTKKEKAIKF